MFTPVEIFGRALLSGAQQAYDVALCAPTPEIDAGSLTLHIPERLQRLAAADTIIVPGRTDPLAPLPDTVIAALQQAHARGARIASICVGAFTLAAAGLLDGLRATTHWVAAGELARRYPKIQVDAAVLFVDNGQMLTSAGAAAGIDLCLHMIRQDYGAAVAAHAAKLAVMPLVRDGGQAQFIVHAQPTSAGRTLEPLLWWVEANTHRPLTLDDLAAQAQMGRRTLTRHFHKETGTTPMLWLNRVRLRQAQVLLETTSLSMEVIASQVGFGSLTTFRDRFKALVGVSPRSYRQTFRGQHG